MPSGLIGVKRGLAVQHRRKDNTVLGDILQPTHLLLILVVALLVLGPKRLPEAGRSIGQGLREFRASIRGREGDEP